MACSGVAGWDKETVGNLVAENRSGHYSLCLEKGEVVSPEDPGKVASPGLLSQYVIKVSQQAGQEISKV